MARSRRLERGTGSFGIWVDGADGIGHSISELSKEIRDFRPAWDLLAPRLMAAVRNIIASRGHLVHHEWPRPSAAYKKRKAREGYGATQLRRTGKLMSELDVISKRPMSMRFGVRLPYARAMNFGFWDHNIPPRPFLFSKGGGTSDEIVRAAHEEISRHVDVLLARMRSTKVTT